MLHRRDFFKIGSLGILSTLLPGLTACTQEKGKIIAFTDESINPDFQLSELTISQLQEKIASGELSSQKITEMYLQRIEDIDKNGPKLNSVIEINPDAMSIAKQMDEERKQGKIRGPLHGIPVMIKDNIDTADKMQTTAGSLALVGTIAAKDSYVVKKLREAGAVIIAKTNLSEWANFRSTNSSSGWSSRGGQTRNPYMLDRSPCGSSSGSGVAVSANLCTVAIGTETDGSVVCPSSINGIVGIKPTIGMVGRSGIIPISHSQDTAGPMARTVTDAATLLGVLTGIDQGDEVTKKSTNKAFSDYTQFLDSNGLEGKRMGIDRSNFGFHDKVDELINKNLEIIKMAGAVLIEIDQITTEKFDWDDEMQLLLFEFKHDLNKYLSKRGHSNMKTLNDLIQFNIENKSTVMPYFGQEIFTRAQKKGDLNSAEYLEIKSRIDQIVRKNGIDRVMKEHQLDAIIAPTTSPAWTIDLVNGDHYIGGSSGLAAMAGYPNITVPAGYVEELPVGISFYGAAWAEPKLIGIAYAFEQLTNSRKLPELKPTMEY